MQKIGFLDVMAQLSKKTSKIFKKKLFIPEFRKKRVEKTTN